MKKKVIAGIICALAGITVLVLRNIAPWLFPLAAAVVSVMATYEINHALGIKNKLMRILTGIVSFAIPMCFGFRENILAFGARLDLTLNPVYFLLLYALLCFIIMIADFENIKFHDAASVIVTSWGIPFAVTVLLYCNEIDKIFPNAGYGKHHGLFFILYVMFCAWITDVFAYFAGSFLGKHKLCPKVSPKKTVEGAIGGVLGGVASVLILYAIFDNLIFEAPHGKYLAVALVSAVLCIVGMCGDLTFSVLKRNCGVKDFSNLVPGHGGVMDRFDSEVFVLIAFYSIINIFGVVF